MLREMFHLLRAASIAPLIAPLLLAGNFAPPTEGPIAFRRDKLPLDSETMRELSGHLTTLADHLHAKTPEHRRCAAQMLAVATALDPANATARDLIADYEAERHSPPAAEPTAAATATARVIQLFKWLESPEVGSHGHALAACLADIIAVADQGNAKSVAIISASQQGAWSGWVPELTAYQAPAAPAPPPPVEIAPTAPKPPFHFPLTSAAVSTIVPKAIENTDPRQWELAPVTLKLTASILEPVAPTKPITPADAITRPGHFAYPPGDPRNRLDHFRAHSERFSFNYGTWDTRRMSSTFTTTFLNILEKHHPGLPQRAHLAITADGTDLATSNIPSVIPAAAFVLASAALSGSEPDAIVLGNIDSKDTYRISEFLLEELALLHAAPTGGPRKLILPSTAEPLLTSLVTLGKVDFFLRHEVLLATSPSEILALAAKSPAEPLANSSTQFQEIRAKSPTLSAKSYLQNPFVLRRCAEIFTQSPSHFSAKILVLQGSGKIPATLSRPILAAEIRRALKPMEWVTNKKTEEGSYTLFTRDDIAKIDSISDQCEASLDALKPFASSDATTLLTKAREATATLKPLARAARGRGDEYESRDAISLAHSLCHRAYHATLEELTAVRD